MRITTITQLVRLGALVCLAALAATALTATAAHAAAGPAWDIKAEWGDTNLPPGGGLPGSGSIQRFGFGVQRQEFFGAPAHPAGAAVNPTNGDLYVIDIANFATGGATLRTYDAQGDEAGTPCTLEWAPGTPLPQPGVDSSGDIYYPNTKTGSVQKLKPDCSEVPFAHAIAGLVNPDSVALDSTGDVYVVDGTNKGTEIASGRLQKFAADGTPMGAFAGLDGSTTAKGEITSVAVDQSSGDVYVGHGWDASFHIQRYSKSGSLTEEFGAGTFHTASGSNYASDQIALVYNQIAVNDANKTVYATNPVWPGEAEVFAVSEMGRKRSAPLKSGQLASSVAVNQESHDVYVVSAGSLQNQGMFILQLRNDGTAASEEDLTITDHLPHGVTAGHIDWASTGSVSMEARFEVFGEIYEFPVEVGLSRFCSGEGTETVTCVLPKEASVEYYGFTGKVHPMAAVSKPFDGTLATAVDGGGVLPLIYIEVEVGKDASGMGTNVARVEGGGAAPFEDTDEVSFDNTPASFGTRYGGFLVDNFDASYPFGAPDRQAGDHPFELRVDFELNQKGGVGNGERYDSTNALLRDVNITMPPGWTANPEAVPKCKPVDFAISLFIPACPPDTQVGYISFRVVDGPLWHGQGTEGTFNIFIFNKLPIYNLVPPKGKLTDFGFSVLGFIRAHIYSALDPARHYAITALSPDVSATGGVTMQGAEVTLWGVPADPAHDRYRLYTGKTTVENGARWGTAPIRPFITNAMDCGVENGGATIRVGSYQHPDQLTPLQEYGSPMNVEGCDDPRFRFQPDVSLEPTDRHAGAPTGLEVKLKVPQRNDEVENAGELYAMNGNVKAIATPPIKKTVVTLPEGMTLNPSAGQGLGGCTLAQLGMSASGVPNGEPVRCPANSQIGTLVMHSPDLPENEPLTGRVYVAKENENPFGSIFALYLVLENAERGLLVKLAGKIELDPVTGQIKTTFDNLPQFPVADFSLKFKSGPRAALVNPATCGAKTITAEYWSWQDPNRAHVATSSYDVTQRPDGSPCLNSLSERPYAPQLSAGTLNPAGGAFSPFVVHLTRTDEDQEISTLSVTLPNGLLAKLTGVAQCPEAGIAQAQDSKRTGAEELANPSCPASSQIGTVLVGTGTGASLTWVPGNVYLAGPYEGAPFSIVVITPAVVGPYDLGAVVVRSALYIDPTTAQATVKTDPLPQILKGIPVRIRDVRVTVDRPQFTFNPTDCSELRVGGGSGSIEGASVSLSDRFQAADCATLAFKPSFGASTSGKTSRARGASLSVKLSDPKAAWGTQANIHMVKVSLPKQLPSRLTTLQKACPDSTFATNPAACPPASRVGTASSTTPILPVTLAGPAYFVSHGGAKFPELVIVLQGDGVTVDLHGETFINKAGITSSTFRAIPDVPVSTFQLTLPQGANSALAANGKLCAHKLVMPTVFTAQNGLVVHQNTVIKTTGCAKRRSRGARRHRGSGRRKRGRRR